MKREQIVWILILLLAALLLAAPSAAQRTMDTTEEYTGRGLVFAADGGLYFEAEEGGVYLLEGLDISDLEDCVVRIAGTVRETEDAGPVLTVADAVRDEKDKQDGADDAPLPGRGQEQP